MENNDALMMFDSTVKYSGDVIFIQPFCDFFQIDYLNQKKSINNNSLIKRYVSKKTSMLLFGDERERIALTKQGFITWILQLRCQLVHPSLQEKLLQYQTLIFDFMFGNIKNEENTKLIYARLKKLKRLKSKIGLEIKRCEDEVQGYLNSKFVQGKLELRT
jgi:hypothetical protein